MLKILFLSLVLSSCGLIEKFKTPEGPTDSKEATSANDSASASSDDLTNTPASANSSDETDDLFSKTMEETSNSQAAVNKDSPSNISDDSELKSLEDEFSTSGPRESVVKESSIAVKSDSSMPKNVSEAPVFVEEALPEIKTEVETPTYSEAGKIKSYRVKSGDTLMQVAFKLYGDISKWKEIKNMNKDLISNNSSLRANSELKYRAPQTPFVWNPAGNPHLIKTGETLGTISNTVYGTPKKWKAVWENNKPLIKNPNVIYAGFTLYYTNGGMANFVQPKSAQPTEEIVARELAKSEQVRNSVSEEIIVEKIAEKTAEKIEVAEELQTDEAIQSLSAPTRNKAVIKSNIEKNERAEQTDNELDLINNVSVPMSNEFAPDIDEELQTL
jgi:nucleoid-associated protein YgaU